MKKEIFVAMGMICAFATSFAQSKTPVAVTTAFNQKFPGATQIKWNKEGSHEFEAAFVWKSEHYSANFSDSGKWLETEYPFTFNQLPDAVKKVHSASYKESVLKSVSKIEKSEGGIKYEVEIKQGKKIVELFYTPDGTQTKE